MKLYALMPVIAGLLVAGPAAAYEISPATERAVALADGGKLREGMAMLEAAAARQDVSALCMLALIYLAAEQPARGLPHAEAALRLAPRDADVLIARGRVLAALDQPDKALADFEQALSFGPKAEALYERGLLRADAGEHEKALADFRLAFQTDPEWTDALSASAHELEVLQRPDEALAAWDLLVRLGVAGPAILERRGDLLMAMERFEAAASDYEGAVKADPKNAQLHVALGSAWEARGDDRRASAAYTAATRADPTYVYGWWNSGRMLQADGRWKPALAAFDRAVALDPVNAELLADRGLARYYADDDRALADFDAALKADPKSAYALMWRGAYFVAVDEPAKALVDLDAALKLEPDDSSALGFRARAMLMLNRHDRALADINSAIKTSKIPLNLTIRGEIYSAMGDHLQAVEAFDEAIALDPTYADAWMERSKSKAELGEKDAAAADRARALKLDPSLAS